MFLALHLVPGDPAELLLSAGSVAPDPAAVAELREKLGLDRPLLDQYVSFLAGLAHGDLGNSLVDDYPVTSEIALRLPRTLELILAAIAAGGAARHSRRHSRRRASRRRFDRIASAIDGVRCLRSRCSCSARC